MIGNKIIPVLLVFAAGFFGEVAFVGPFERADFDLVSAREHEVEVDFVFREAKSIELGSVDGMADCFPGNFVVMSFDLVEEVVKDGLLKEHVMADSRKPWKLTREAGQESCHMFKIGFGVFYAVTIESFIIWAEKLHRAKENYVGIYDKNIGRNVWNHKWSV